jgi:hypothetical protein
LSVGDVGGKLSFFGNFLLVFFTAVGASFLDLTVADFGVNFLDLTATVGANICFLASFLVEVLAVRFVVEAESKYGVD